MADPIVQAVREATCRQSSASPPPVGSVYSPDNVPDQEVCEERLAAGMKKVADGMALLSRAATVEAGRAKVAEGMRMISDANACLYIHREMKPKTLRVDFVFKSYEDCVDKIKMKNFASKAETKVPSADNKEAEPFCRSLFPRDIKTDPISMPLPVDFWFYNYNSCIADTTTHMEGIGTVRFENGQTAETYCRNRYGSQPPASGGGGAGGGVESESTSAEPAPQDCRCPSRKSYSGGEENTDDRPVCENTSHCEAPEE